jgi:hypothetical protein
VLSVLLLDSHVAYYSSKHLQPPFHPVPPLPQVSYLELDEADKLLALGFAEQVDALLARIPHVTLGCHRLYNHD